MAAGRGDVAQLADKLRAKGLSDDEVVEGLRGMGFSKAEAEAAAGVSQPSTPQPRKRTAPAKRSASSSPKPQGGRSAGGSPEGETSTPPGPPAVPAPPSIPAPDLSQVTLTPPKSFSGGDLGGFLAGLVLYTLGLNFLRYGVDGPKGWIRAKFLNEPYVEASTKGTKHNGGKHNGGNGLVSTRPAAPTKV